MTACLVWWLARLTASQEVPDSISGYTLEIFFWKYRVWNGVHPTSCEGNWIAIWIGKSEIRLRKLKLRLRDKRFANHKAACTVIWQQPLQEILALRGCSAMDLLLLLLLLLLFKYCVHRCGASGSMRACHAASPSSIPGRDRFPGWGFFGVFPHL